MSDVDKIDVQINIAKGKKSFSILQAASLWCELDIHDNHIKRWIKEVCEPSRSSIDQIILYSPFLPLKETQQLRDISIRMDLIRFELKLENDEGKLNRLRAEFNELKDRAKQIINTLKPSQPFKMHLAMRERVSSLVSNMLEICDGGRADLEQQITRDQLLDLARIRKESPGFLEPEDEGEIHPKTRTVWLRLIAASLLEAKLDPREQGMVDAVMAMAERHGMQISRSTIAKILKQIKEEDILPGPGPSDMDQA